MCMHAGMCVQRVGGRGEKGVHIPIIMCMSVSVLHILCVQEHDNLANTSSYKL